MILHHEVDSLHHEVDSLHQDVEAADGAAIWFTNRQCTFQENLSGELMETNVKFQEKGPYNPVWRI